jgi:hypothetical protein
MLLDPPEVPFLNIHTSQGQEEDSKNSTRE